MIRVATHAFAVLFLLTVACDVGLGVHVLLAESVALSAFGVPVEVRGTEKAFLAVLCFVPAVAMTAVAWSLRGRPKGR